MQTLILTTLLSLLFLGCSSSQNAGTSISEKKATNPFIGTWALQDSSSAIHFLSSGDVTLQPGIIVAAINRFQNTQKSRYTSRLLYTGRYEVPNNKELLLFVTADWTGKGTGARRPADRRVESIIRFEIASLDQSTMTLRKKSLTQDNEEMALMDEDLELSLFFIE